MDMVVDRLRLWAAELWETTQVELHGYYSVDRLRQLEHYCATTSWLRALVVCLVTPIPCIVFILLLDLLPLEAPEKGTFASPIVWLRFWLTSGLMATCTQVQIHYHIPQLALTRWQYVWILNVSTAVGVGVAFALSSVVGYPLPFTVIVGTIPWFITLLILLFLVKHRKLRENRSLIITTGRYLLVIFCQVVMTVVYPSYNFVYSRLSSTQQTGFILLLPVIKIAAKNWISRALPDTDDAKPEAVVFNVEIFHSLFAALCMGKTTSTRTIVALMFVDFVQAWLSFDDVRRVMKHLQPIVHKLNTGGITTAKSKPQTSLQSLVTIANEIIKAEPFRASSRVLQHQDVFSRPPERSRGLVPRSIVPISDTVSRIPQLPPPSTFNGQIKASKVGNKEQLGPPRPVLDAFIRPFPPRLANLTGVERNCLVQNTQKLLFIIEYVVLIEYTEVIVPLIYDMLVFVMFHCRNRTYYSFLYGVCTTASLYTTTTTVLLYAMLELVSLLLMGIILSWRLRFSLLHQLAFVLETRAINIQSKLLLWVLDTMQSSILQLGHDYSFQFEWLRHHDTNMTALTAHLGPRKCT